MKLSFRLITILCLLLGAIAPTLHAQDLGAIRERMVQRLGTIDSLKADGAIGENNQGFVEVRSKVGEAARVVAEENADRQIVYAAIAQKTGSTAAQVGQARARQIASGSASGVWLQSASGSWYQK